MCSIVNLFLVVQSYQQIAAQPTMKTRLDRPARELIQRRKSLKEEGFQLTRSQSLMQLQMSLSKEQ